jgi:membrane associated rhomboid family serine protease
MPNLPPRRRAPGSDWFRRVNDYLTPTVKAVVIVDTAIFLFFVLVRQSRTFIATHLALGARLFAGELWQPITSLFVHLDFFNFLINLVGLWSVGSTIDRARGRGRFLTLFFGTGVLANLVIAAFYWHREAPPVVFHDGGMFAVVALFVANARIFGRQPAQLWPIPIFLQARYVTLIIIGFLTLSFVTQGRRDMLAALAVTVAFSYFAAAAGGMTELRTFFANARDAAKVRRHRRRFGVIQGGDRPPKKKYVN